MTASPPLDRTRELTCRREGITNRDDVFASVFREQAGHLVVRCDAAERESAAMEKHDRVSGIFLREVYADRHGADRIVEYPVHARAARTLPYAIEIRTGFGGI